MSDCIFCKIIKGEIPCYKIAENKNAIAFLDVTPYSNGHTLIIPKKHYPNLSSTPEKILNDVMKLTKVVVKKLTKSLKPSGFNYVSNENEIAGQCVFHFHLHVIPKYSKNEGFGSKFLGGEKKEVKEIFEILWKK